MAWKCFLIEDTGLVERHVSRWEEGQDAPCPLGADRDGAHFARVILGHYRRDDPTDKRFLDDDDPRWPQACACGHVFVGEWTHSGGSRGIWRRPETGEVYTDLYRTPYGAMWHAYWLVGTKGHRVGDDGRCLMVNVPGGPWCIDGPSYNNGQIGPGWQRSGDAPTVTVQPSILTPAYHGFLSAGILTDDLEGRMYDRVEKEWVL